MTSLWAHPFLHPRIRYFAGTTVSRPCAEAASRASQGACMSRGLFQLKPSPLPRLLTKCAHRQIDRCRDGELRPWPAPGLPDKSRGAELAFSESRGGPQPCSAPHLWFLGRSWHWGPLEGRICEMGRNLSDGRERRHVWANVGSAAAATGRLASLRWGGPGVHQPHFPWPFLRCVAWNLLGFLLWEGEEGGY